MSCLYSAAHREEAFLVRAQTLMSDYARVQDPAYLHDEVPELIRQITQMLLNNPPPPPNASMTMCSNFGVVDGIVKQQYSEIKLEAVRVGVEVDTRENVLHVWTFEERLNLAFCWNSAFYRKETVEGYLRQLVEILGREVGVVIG